ncbi:hypothetical protein IRJ34_09965 [Paenarthrobacter sp. GOM3]|uniref:hypothetical protein n=1 Tax=Paenarthrobacter sp. GOM3 TaxID=2782567 RepID=UPI001BAD5101|nr:hypothetical protein [Paenarthrobacter sp. GOM3]WOH20619.1 hypothetical protein IRJ34_09965 [Paenarthrobacter sp. GOM3]
MSWEQSTPWVAIAVMTIAAGALTLAGNLGSLAETVVLLLLFVFIRTNLAVPVLRKDKVSHQHFYVLIVVPSLALTSRVRSDAGNCVGFGAERTLGLLGRRRPTERSRTGRGKWGPP